MGVQTGLAVRKRFFSNLDCKILEICSPECRFCHSGLQLDRLSSTGALKGYKSGIRESSLRYPTFTENALPVAFSRLAPSFVPTPDIYKLKGTVAE